MGISVPGAQGEERGVNVNQIVLVVDKTAVQKLKMQLDMLNREANTVSKQRTLTEIKACQKLLFKATGILDAMEKLELLTYEEINLIKEDQNRIHNKIINILDEKKKASQVLQHK